MDIVFTTILLLAAVALGDCNCPANRRHALGNCSYKIVCEHDMSEFHVPRECQVSTNSPVTVKLILRNPRAFNDSLANLDQSSIHTITSFQAYDGKWPQENMDIIKQMYALKQLHLVRNSIKHIDGYPFYRLYSLEEIDLSQNQLSSIETLFQISMQQLRILSLAHNMIESISGDVFDSVTSLQVLDLSYNSINNLNSDSFRDLWRLQLLKLDHNSIDSIPDGIFDNATSLEELDLSNNSISSLNNNSFGNLPRLRTLKLDGNKIVDLDGAFNSLKFLTHLYLKGNQIQNIDTQSLHVINHLETFDVSANQIENIASDIFARHWYHFNCQSRCRIILSDNHLTSLPNATSETYMRHGNKTNDQNFSDTQTELDVSKNSISTIEFYAFHNILQLTSLDLSLNKLTSFVVHADDLRHVTYLNLSYNFIRNLDYKSFSSMRNLQNLDLSFNQLENVPEPTFISNYMLRYVNMSDNELGDITNLHITFNQKGGVLDLSNNSIRIVNIPQGETLRLLMLVLKSNIIDDISLIELRQQNELKFLDMSKNYIRELNESSLHLPSSLQDFDLTHNEIMFIAPSVFKDLRNLRTLRLSHNNIQHIEYGTFRSLATLEALDLSFNDIQILDSKVFTDLNSLQTLSIRNNGMFYLDYKSWIGHKHVVQVNMDGNTFDCQWLAAAISDYSNGISMIKPTASEPVETGHNLKGISCLENAPQALMDGLDADRTLLVITSNILEAVREQTKLLKAQLRYQIPSLHQIGAHSYNEVK